MDISKQSFLESLIQWGEDAKSTLENADIPENSLSNWVGQLDTWQEDIKSRLASEQNITGDNLELLRAEGKKIISEVNNNNKVKPERSSVPVGKHKLPPLPYEYNALEPYICEEIMRLHHDVHHKSYVDGLNKAEVALYKNKKEDKVIKHWLREQAYNGSGHNLHTIFWFNMTPESSKEPSEEIRKRIDKDFGSWKEFKKLFTDVASSVEGVGWAILLWDPRSGRLAVQSFEKHQLFQLADTIPLLVLDMWEHAYYLQYKTDKKEYIKNWWNVVNWKNVNDRWIEARKVEWPLF